MNGFPLLELRHSPHLPEGSTWQDGIKLYVGGDEWAFFRFRIRLITALACAQMAALWPPTPKEQANDR